MNELSQTLIDTVNEAYRRFCDCSQNIRGGLLDLCNTKRAVGVHLLGVKAEYKGSNWMGLFKRANAQGSVSFPFSYEAACLFIRYAKANPQPIADLELGIASVKDSMIACGALAAPLGHGRQKIHERGNFFSQLMQITAPTFGQWKSLWGKQLTEHPMDTWSEDERQQVLSEIQPLRSELNRAYDQLTSS